MKLNIILLEIALTYIIYIIYIITYSKYILQPQIYLQGENYSTAILNIDWRSEQISLIFLGVLAVMGVKQITLFALHSYLDVGSADIHAINKKSK